MRSFASRSTLVVVCALLAAGCQTAAHNQGGLTVPPTQSSSTPQTSSAMMPGQSNAANPGAPIAQVGYNGPIDPQVPPQYATARGPMPAGALPIGPGPLQSLPMQSSQFAPTQASPAGYRPIASALVHTGQGGPIRNTINAVGGQMHAGCQSCGNGGCQSGDCENTQPFGYVEIAPQGWNAYGVDPQEFICDGGDNPPEAKLTQTDQIVGLQPEDTVVHYTSDAGDIEFQASNRVCVYSPRFASIRKVTQAIAGEKVVGSSLVDRPVGPGRFEVDLGGLVMQDSLELGHADVARGLDSLRDRNRGVRVEGDWAPVSSSNVLDVLATISNLQTGEMADEQIALLQEGANAAVAWTIGESVEVAVEDMRAPVITRDQTLDAFTVYEFPDAGRLRIVKMADKEHAPSGDEVGFAIRVQNVGDSAVNQVVITDNLITRMEYVPDSQESDREVEFTTHANSGQSLRLQWELKEPLKVGESLLIEFRCKVR
ncbi:MAG: DUF11 domain-containing protein [Pirellulaceae bacterium]|nr:DUF11 domain-containing protein [Pirellulaceae bacterium]